MNLKRTSVAESTKAPRNSSYGSIKFGQNNRGKKSSLQNAYNTGKSLEIRQFIKFINRLLKDQKDLIRNQQGDI